MEAFEQESIITSYYISGVPQTTRNYPLNEYIGPVTIGKVRTAGRGLFVTQPVDCGQSLLISNSEAACICYHMVEGVSTFAYPPAAEHPRTTHSDLQDCRNEPDEVEKFGVQAGHMHVDPLFVNRQKHEQGWDDRPGKADGGKECGTGTEPNLTPCQDRIPHEVCLHLATGLLNRITSFCKSRQIFSLDHRKNSLMSDDHIDMPIHDVHFYRNEPSARTATTERTIFEKAKQKVEAHESPCWMDKPEKPIKRASDEEAVTTSMIMNIVARNASFDQVRSRCRDDPKIIQKCHLWGVWLLPSFINHSCAPNCNRFRVGDALIIRASRSLLAGEELTLPYFNIFEPLQLREKSAKLWGFRCECPRCTFERSRGETFEDIQRMVINLKQDLDIFWEDQTDPNEAEGYRLLVKLASTIPYIDIFLSQLEPNSHSDKHKLEEVSPENFPETQHVGLPRITQTMRKDNEGAHRDKQAQKSRRLQKIGHRSSKKEKAKARQHARTEIVVQPNLDRGDNRDKELDLDKERKHIEKYWIMGSFIDAYIAEYALSCKGMSSTRGLSKFEQLLGIFKIIGNVHPGHMLGHDYGQLMLELLNNMVKRSVEEEVQQTEPNARLSSHLTRVTFEIMILEFVAAFYGPQDRAVLLTLLQE